MEVSTNAHLSLLALLAAFLPLISFVWGILFSKPAKGSVVAVSSIFLSFICSVIVFIGVWNKQGLHEQVNWFTVGNWNIQAGLLLNNLSVLMMPLVSGIALLVHIYSIGYMKNEPYLHRYWAYLGLFCFSMMSLVIADSLLLVYLFWELVGFSSYLLIGFWFTRDAATMANRKAFIMNRIGDLGFLAAIMILYAQFQTLDILQLFGENGLVERAVIQNGQWIAGDHQMPAAWLTLVGAALFFAAAAKSAQFPLHTWLPDAMEGPTAVSSLIHAATMVAAGVFLLARVYPVFDPLMLDIITGIGVFTAFMAATIALVQNDIKKILAYSTISQLGFMMLALGTGAYTAGIFHLATHAFFKCLLFLAAGAVIHEMHHLKDREKLDFDHQDIRNMGGLRKHMPVTFITMLVAALSLAGIPLTSGYLSKDAILIHAFEWSVSGSFWAKLVPVAALITSWLTMFYIARLIFKVFFGKLRISGSSGFSIHDAPAVMKYPLIILAICSTFLVFSFDPLLFENAWIVTGFPIVETLERVNAFHTMIPATVNLVGAGIIYFAFVLYVKKNEGPVSVNNPFFRFAQEKWFIDEVYQVLFVRPVVVLAGWTYTFDKVVVDGVVNLIGIVSIFISDLASWFDRNIIDGIINLSGSVSKSIGNFTRHFQTGRLQHYLVTMLIIILTFFILKYFSPAI